LAHLFRRAAPFVLLAASFLLLYGGVVRHLVHDWIRDENYSHGFLIIPLALYFAWERRTRLAALSLAPSNIGLIIVFGSLGVLLAGVLGAELFLTRVSLIGLTAGSIVFLLGWQALRVLAFPVALLLLMIPIPALIFNQIAFPLQLLASQVGETALRTLGVPVLREGNVIVLANTSLEVAEACSGIRSLISLLTLGIVYSPAWARSNGGNFNAEINYYDIKVTNAIAAIDPQVTLNNCALLGDAASCALTVRTSNGFVNEIDGTLDNLDSIRTKGLDITANYRTPATSAGRFGVTVNATHLFKYVLTASNGFVVLDRKGTERGSPDQAFPEWKGNATLDWSLSDFAASFTGRYIDSVIETSGTNVGHKMGSRFYSDFQFIWTPSMLEQRFAFTLGVNNLFDKDPPACWSCSGANYDPGTYDAPGRFGYARISYHM